MHDKINIIAKFTTGRSYKTIDLNDKMIRHVFEGLRNDPRVHSPSARSNDQHFSLLFSCPIATEMN